ncbi:MAG: molecular chaperone TorD family protein [Gemmatimonadota bacterium]
MPDGTPIELLRSLAVFAEAPTRQHGTLSEALGFESAPSPASYADVFSFQLYPYASVYSGPEGMMGGEARDRVAGLWRALGHDVPTEPDHLAAMLGLYAELSAASGTMPGPEAALVDEGRRTLLSEHLAPWLFVWLERAGEIAPSPYRAWAETLHQLLRAEVRRLGVGDVPPSHALRSCPGLSDPRDAGSAAFVADLLAYARTGVLVTRADLATIAHRLDLGLRAGERRYALEHLLAQDAPAVLGALAEAAESAASAHRARAPWLPQLANHFGERAEATHELLRSLEREASVPAESGS